MHVRQIAAPRVVVDHGRLRVRPPRVEVQPLDDVLGRKSEEQVVEFSGEKGL